MSGNGTQLTHTPHDTQSWQNALEELQMLLAEPINADTGITRTGKIVGLRITPLSSQDHTQLIVSFFPLVLDLPRETKKTGPIGLHSRCSWTVCSRPTYLSVWRHAKLWANSEI